MKHFYLGLISILLIATHSYGVDRAYLKAARIQEMSEPAPDFTLKGPGGGPISLGGLKGKVVMLHFWATWCKPCKDEFPRFEKVYREFGGGDFVLLPVAIDTAASRAEIESFARGLGAGFPVYLSAEGDVTGKYWAWGVPATYFVDRRGTIVGRAIGPRDWGSREVRDLIEALLKED